MYSKLLSCGAIEYARLPELPSGAEFPRNTWSGGPCQTRIKPGLRLRQSSDGRFETYISPKQRQGSPTPVGAQPDPRNEVRRERAPIVRFGSGLWALYPISQPARRPCQHLGPGCKHIESERIFTSPSDVFASDASYRMVGEPLGELRGVEAGRCLANGESGVRGRRVKMGTKPESRSCWHGITELETADSSHSSQIRGITVWRLSNPLSSTSLLAPNCHHFSPKRVRITSEIRISPPDAASLILAAMFTAAPM